MGHRAAEEGCDGAGRNLSGPRAAGRAGQLRPGHAQQGDPCRACRPGCHGGPSRRSHIGPCGHATGPWLPIVKPQRLAVAKLKPAAVPSAALRPAGPPLVSGAAVPGGVAAARRHPALGSRRFTTPADVDSGGRSGGPGPDPGTGIGDDSADSLKRTCVVPSAKPPGSLAPLPPSHSRHRMLRTRAARSRARSRPERPRLLPTRTAARAFSGGWVTGQMPLRLCGASLLEAAVLQVAATDSETRRGGTCASVFIRCNHLNDGLYMHSSE